jgi:hypothetical protein
VGMACTAFCFLTQDTVLENENNCKKKQIILLDTKNYSDLKKKLIK